MQTYFDLSEKQRALLTEDQVKAFVAVHLMEQGVVFPAPLVLDPVPENKIQTSPYFAVKMGLYGSTQIAFKTIADANTFASLDMYEIKSSYYHGVECVSKCDTAHIVTVQLANETDVRNTKAESARIAEIVKSNDLRTKEHEKATEACAKASEVIWSDWHTQRNAMSRYKEIMRVYADYLRTCDSNSEMALRFLHKAYPSADCDLAFVWTETPQ